METTGAVEQRAGGPAQPDPSGPPMATGSRVLGRRHTGRVLLRPLNPFRPTRLEEVFGCAGYTGPPKTIEEMDAGLAIGVKAHDDRD